jgi:hypothetical protein
MSLDLTKEWRNWHNRTVYETGRPPWLLSVSAKDFPVLSRVDMYGEVTVSCGDMPSVVSEVALLLGQAERGPEQRGLLRLRALALAGQDTLNAVLRFSGD